METIAEYRIGSAKYERIVRLIVSDHLDNNKLYDSSYGAPTRDRYNTIEHGVPALNDSTPNRFHDYIKVPTDDLNEWFFICATYNPGILEDESLSGTYYDDYKNNKQFWLNHIDPAEDFTDNALFQNFTIGTLTGPRDLFIETFYNEIPLRIHNDISTQDDNVVKIVDDMGNEYSAEIFSKNGSQQNGYDLGGYFIGPDSGTDEANEIYNDLYGEGAEVQVSVGVQITPPSPSILTQSWDSLINTEDVATMVANSGFGARCKVEVISRSDLLRARGYKVGSLEVNADGETLEQEQQQEQEQSSA